MTVKSCEQLMLGKSIKKFLLLYKSKSLECVHFCEGHVIYKLKMLNNMASVTEVYEWH